MNICVKDLQNCLGFSAITDLLSYRGQNQPQQKAYTFLRDGETDEFSLTYQELEEKAKAIASRLQSLGGTGERALLLYPPGLEFITAFLGCLYAGVIAVPAYPPRKNMNFLRLQSIIKDAQATLILTTSSLLTDLVSQWAENPELPNMRWLSTDDIDNYLSSHWQQPKLDENSLAFLQYTSGSTGTPKGVMVTHGNLLSNQRSIQIGFGHTEKTIFVGWLPLFHDMGLIGNVLQPLYLGIPSILMSPVAFLQKPLRWLQAISRYKATTSGGPNFAYDLCARKITPEELAHLDLSSWEIAFNGAEPVRADTIEKFTNHFAPCGFRKEAFYPCYGMAETTLFVSGGLKTSDPVLYPVEATALEENRVIAAKSDQTTKTIVGCGRTWLEEKIAIVDPDSLTLCPDDRIGEIWVSGPSVAAGYWRKPEQTAETFQAYLSDTGEGPFLRTGDLGFLQNGELFVTGRLKDVIIIRGQNHYPQDIELTVQNSHPALRLNSGAAFTIEQKGQQRLVVVQEVERTYLRKLDIKEVVGNITEAVIDNHGIQLYATVLIKPGSIPKTSSGKIQRHACHRGFLEGTLSVVEDCDRSLEHQVKLQKLVTDVNSLLIKVQEVNPDVKREKINESVKANALQ
ncbi:fatty acyl-AMP ligase [Anabaena aphanizomenioides LEGE 00250]|uniref:Fatty acyl-AMP ligase n=1 Tax=Sphaerospermopsis aphanizomenoides LEGE 00250 TaxID=2777972 RepID=A0ABR9VD20_9CYAN|nr:fatty acyl-AMP ligase [Sphaerospermopsis aphanizomenoides]MBE9235320.1 fatty acyl-AMP ligase [Sphaerospermopsis aphanizomenoides LEGE 00250]